LSFSALLAFGAGALCSTAQLAGAQGAAKPEAPKEAELPHPFFTHMGLPEGVGNFNLRLLGLATRIDGKSDGDFAFHLETGLTPSIGLHVRNDRTLNNDKTEAMFQFAAYVSKDSMSGFAPIVEFEFPTHSGASRISALVGFTSTLGAPDWAFNNVVHYDPREDMVDASAALVVKATGTVFPVLELLFSGGEGQLGVVNGLAGVKVRLQDWLIGGVAFQFPLTRARNLSSQLALGPDIEWKR
jgi:hypothetical protein